MYLYIYIYTFMYIYMCVIKFSSSRNTICKQPNHLAKITIAFGMESLAPPKRTVLPSTRHLPKPPGWHRRSSIRGWEGHPLE